MDWGWVDVAQLVGGGDPSGGGDTDRTVPSASDSGVPTPPPFKAFSVRSSSCRAASFSDSRQSSATRLEGGRSLRLKPAAWSEGNEDKEARETLYQLFTRTR